jgi:hypothetical protein
MPVGCLNQDMGRFKEAEDYLLRAISMRETLCGPNHPDGTAICVCRVSCVRACADVRVMCAVHITQP